MGVGGVAAENAADASNSLAHTELTSRTGGKGNAWSGRGEAGERRSQGEGGRRSRSPQLPSLSVGALLGAGQGGARRGRVQGQISSRIVIRRQLMRRQPGDVFPNEAPGSGGALIHAPRHTHTHTNARTHRQAGLG